ncbi:MAG: Clp protease ClpP, partial [Oscillospiraceae bacterium]|nr:Clp protease ClpP [Oscillospiraceae bacterium]
MKPFDIKRPCYAMASKNGTDAEITLYGDVVERRPVDWWTGKEIEGSFIIQDEFLEDLKAVAGCKRVTIRLNSYGGDAVVGMLIHNRLREMARGGTALTCVVDAVAMSAASVIMSACDTVQVNATGLVMIHKAAAFQFGWYNADDLGEEKAALDQYDSAIAAAYARKTGMAQEELLTMMGETTYLTGKDAVELGFADELLEDAEPLKLAASADGT